MTGPVYMRLLRGNVPLVLDQYDYKFELGKAKMIRDGTRRAGDLLRLHDHARAGGRRAAASRTGSTSAVLHVPTIKPLDEATILREAAKSGRLVVVAENHTIIGGLGEAIAGVLLRAGVAPKPSGRSALPDEFLRRRRAADAARPLRHLGRRDGAEHQGLALGRAESAAGAARSSTKPKGEARLASPGAPTAP